MDVSAVLTLVQTILQLFDSTIWSEIESVLGVESQLERLRETMSTINNFFLDAEQQERLHQGRCSNVERDRLERLKKALYQADDLFDEVITLARRNELISNEDNNLCNKVCLFFSTSNQFTSAFYWSREIKKIRNMLDDIVNDHQIIGLGHPVVSVEAGRVRTNPRETYSLVCEEEDVIIGRDDDKQSVIDMLLKTTVEADVCAISIVGIGGLGKTTLAQLVYNDEKIVRDFPLRMWVCVSDDFNVEVLLRKILTAATNRVDNNGLSLDQLQTDLRKALDGKKYLLVLDDIWNENSEEWRKLRNVLFQGGKGSRIVVTTRSRTVANIVGSQKIHELKGLSEEDSWNLFERMTLEPGQHRMEAHLVAIGKEIVGKCANVPLALRVTGSLLRGHGEERWRYMNNTDFAKVKQDEIHGIIPVLKISYYYLPFHLKSCFSYCSIFPKDYKIVKEDLIYLWMAQGFIMPLDGQSFEAAGEEYFMELLQRCFFQDVERDDWGRILSCKMHDLIHDVAREVAGIEIFNKNCFTEKTRHLLTKPPFLYLGTKMKNLRTLLVVYNKEEETCSRKWLLKVRSLRALRLPLNYPIPSMIGELLHLRYIKLSGQKVSVLPKSITKLYNLQTLILDQCGDLKELPRDLSKLVDLRHLVIVDCGSLTDMPQGFGCLTNLQKLTRFLFGGTRNTSAGVSDLKNLNNLRGSMKVEVHRSLKFDAEEVREERCLINKPHLLDINIVWPCSSVGDNNSEAMLECLQPHSNLRMLRLRSYSGVGFPSWGGPSMNLATCLPNLVTISFYSCARLEHLPLMSELRHLKFLTLQYLYEVDYVGSSNISGEGGNKRESRRQVEVDVDETVFFPSLEKLKLECLPMLKGWWKSDLVNTDNNEQQRHTYSYSFPRLSYADISYCPELTTFPLCPKLETLKLMNSNEELLNNGAEGDEVTSSGSITLEGEGEEQEDSDGIQHHIPSRYIAPTLRSLKLYELIEMVKLPMGMRHLTALHSLEISSCNKLEDIPEWISCLSSLRSLTIRSCPRLKSLPEEMRHLTSLQQLELDNLPEMVKLSMGMRHMTALQSLEISRCDSLEDIHEWISCLSSLRSLRIRSCPRLKSLPEEMRHLTSLQQLELDNLPEMVKLSMGMRHMTALQSLEISSCDSLEDIHEWISCLSSLRSLKIWSCPRLKSLPEEMHHLTSLQLLELRYNSEELNNRCRKPNGEDWPKIQHIPNISIKKW